ncbi:carbohydrate-binding domain-containing protein, partial [Paenarthrobacter sp. RAF9]
DQGPCGWKQMKVTHATASTGNGKSLDWLFRPTSWHKSNPGCHAAPGSLRAHFDSNDLTWDAASVVAASLSDGGSRVSSPASTGIAVDGNTVTISATGTYRLSGSLTDGRIVVAAGDSDTVRIILELSTR